MTFISKYSNVCDCSYSGLNSVIISGYVKGVDFRVGHHFRDNNSKTLLHSWNAVQIDRDWQLVDVHWAMRYMHPTETQVSDNYNGLAIELDHLGEEETEHKAGHVWCRHGAIFEYEDFYFLMEPKQAIFSHFPKDSKWQLLSEKEIVTLEQFEDWPVIKPQFFRSGMEMMREVHGTVKTEKGTIKIDSFFRGLYSN